MKSIYSARGVKSESQQGAPHLFGSKGLLRREATPGKSTNGAEARLRVSQRPSHPTRVNRTESNGEVPSDIYEVLDSPAQPLDSVTREIMEPRFGYDFRSVRIHTNALAADSARAMNASAYTVGQNVVFAAGNYAPHTATGRSLIAHELTHVVQQRYADQPSTSQLLKIGPRQDVCEQEAQMYARMTADGPPGTLPRHSLQQIQLQRFAPFEFLGDVFSAGPGEAFARLFGEGEYSEQELVRYLKTLSGGKTEGRYDSDNKARAVVRLWKSGNRALQLTPALKKLLVREMWQGSTTRSDAEGILAILRRSVSEDVKVIFSPGGVTPKELYDAFGKAERVQLQQFFNRQFKGGFDAAMKGMVEPVGAVSVAPYLNDQTFREKWVRGLANALAQLETLIAAGGCRFPRPDEESIDDANWQPREMDRPPVPPGIFTKRRHVAV